MTGRAKSERSRLHAAFGLDDVELFALEDADLKAKALRYDVIPRLELLLRRALTDINDVYRNDPLEFSANAPTPAFRTDRRKGKVENHYTQCTAGITGKRSIHWAGVERIDGRPAKVCPFRLSFVLTPKGLAAEMCCWLARSFSSTSHDRFHSFLTDRLDTLFQIMRIADLTFTPTFVDLLSFRENLRCLGEEPADNWWLSGKTLSVPLGGTGTNELMRAYLLLWPIYDGMLRIAMNRPIRFNEQMVSLRRHLEEHEPEASVECEVDEDDAKKLLDPERRAELELKAAKRVPVMAGLRWQVLSRDGWKCVGCGQSTRSHLKNT